MSAGVGSRPYDLETIRLALEEARRRFDLTESRSREFVTKLQILVAIASILMTFWANTTVRVLLDRGLSIPMGVVAFLPFVPLAVSLAYGAGGIRLAPHSMVAGSFLAEPDTWRLPTAHFRVRVLKGLLVAVGENEDALRAQQRRFKRGWAWMFAGIFLILLSNGTLIFGST